MQFKLLYLFENKMKTETKKYSENFYGSNNCKKAILYNFQKFSESFYFDEVFTDGISMTLQQKLWKEFLTVVKRSIEYVDQVIYQTEKPLNIDYIKYVEYCHEQTCKNYDYITTDGKDLTLKDKMIFEKNKHENILKKSMSKPHFSYDYIANR